MNDLKKTIMAICILFAMVFIGLKIQNYFYSSDTVLILTDEDQDTVLVIQDPKGFYSADTLAYHDPVETVSLPFEIDDSFKLPLPKYDMEFYDYRMSDSVIMLLDTNDILTIYNPNITVIWDTTEVRK